MINEHGTQAGIDLVKLRAEFPDGPARETLERMESFTERMKSLSEDFKNIPKETLANWFFATGCSALIEARGDQYFRDRLKQITAAPDIDHGSLEATRTFLTSIVR